jgi:hypothetical protein
MSAPSQQITVISHQECYRTIAVLLVARDSFKHPFTLHKNQSTKHIRIQIDGPSAVAHAHKHLVARERFELSSKAPEASMLNRYTTGLHYSTLTLKLHCNNFNVAP